MGRTTSSWVVLLSALFLPAVAHGQASRSGPTFSLGGTTAPVERPDIAHDHVNNRYLQVAGKGFIEGHLLNAAGTTISTFRINELPDYAQNPRIGFGADVPGGGGYLVTWNASIGNFARVRGRIFDPNGTPVTSDFDIGVGAVSWETGSRWLDGAAVAYSTGSREFLVAWTGNFGSTNDIIFQRVNTAGALLGANTLVSLGTPQHFDREPSIAYNPNLNEFFIAYAVYDDAVGRGYISGRRVTAGTGAFIGPAPPLPQFGSSAGGMYVPAITYNTNTQQYLLGWTQLTPFQFVNGVVLTSTGVQAGLLRPLSSFYSAYDALDIDYNEAANQSLLVTHGSGGTPWEDAAVTILPDGTAYDNGFILTNTTDVRPLRPNPHSNDGNFNPRMAPSVSEGKWLMVTSSVFAAVHAQFAAAGAINPTEPAIPNPFMWLDFPTPGTTVSGQWALGGWAIDVGAPSGTGVSAVHAWATAHAGGNQIFLGAATLGLSRPDVGAAFGNSRFSPSGFALGGVLPPGGYDITVSAFSTVTSTFNNSKLATINVVQPASMPSMYVDLPAVGQFVSQNITVAGWAVDVASGSGPGVNAVHVWAYPVAGGSPIFMGPASVGHHRPDVAAHLGAARFADSGYALQGGLPPGEYDLAVFAFSYIAGEFNNVVVVRIRVL